MSDPLATPQNLILIIDDKPTNIKLVEEYLASNDFNTIVARDGEMGLKRAKFSKPDLILLDVLMPNMNGYEVCRRLKADGETKGIPVIFMTVKDQVGDKIEGFKAGGVDYITKPAQKEEVLVRVRTHLMLREQRRQLQRQARELEEARHAAESANQAKSQFLAKMSHELRTPLNAILGFGQLMLRDPNATIEQRENLKTINRSGTHLLALINDVLELSKIESGRCEIQQEAFDLHDLLLELEGMFRLRAEQKGILLVFEYRDEVPQYIRSDQNKLRQVLVNILGNAVKFTNKGGIALLARMPASVLSFEIKDTGVGIATEELHRVFDAFAQTASGKKSNQGTGLGMSISRQYVRMMGGDITVISEMGKGSLFSFDIPVETVKAEAVSATCLSRHIKGLKPGQPKFCILIAEDEEDNRSLLVKLLRPMGFEIREAESGREAVEIWKEWRPHLILMDMRMPVIDGRAATQHIRKAEEKMRKEEQNTDHQSGTCIIALTAGAFEEQRTEALESGCDDFVRKPLDINEMLGKMKIHLGLRYIYEERKESQPENRKANRQKTPGSKELAALPADLLENLKQGAIRADLISISNEIGRIREKDERLADTLTRLAEDFDYDGILALIQEKEASSEQEEE